MLKLKKSKWITGCVLSMMTLSSLSSVAHAGENQSWGAVLGGVIGGIAGHNVGNGNGRIVATILGAGLGAALGSQVGQALDDAERIEAQNAYLRSMNGDVNQPCEWSGSRERGNRGRFETRSTFQSDEGYSCRTYVSETWINGQYSRREGTSCRYSDGEWREYERVSTSSSSYSSSSSSSSYSSYVPTYESRREVRQTSCILRDPFGGTYVGHGETDLDAQADASAQCSQHRHPMHCRSEQRCESYVVGESPEYTCMLVDAFSSSYLGRGPSMIDAQGDAIAQCSQSRNPMHCQNEQRCESRDRHRDDDDYRYRHRRF